MTAKSVPACSSHKRGGNTINPARNWCFTLNNYKEEDIISLCSKFNNICSKYLFTKEIGESGTPHLQGFIILLPNTKKRPLELGLTTRIHWELMKERGAIIKNEEYVMKDQKEDDIIYTNYYERPIKLKCLEATKLKLWQTLIIGVIRCEPDDRSIWWLWSEAGKTGKSTFCRYLAIKYKGLLLCGSAKDMKNSLVEYHENTKNWPRLIMIDLPRVFDNDYLSYSGIEEIKNGHFNSPKYKGMTALFNSPHIVVFSNAPPNTSNMSLDRWKIINIDNKIELRKGEAALRASPRNSSAPICRKCKKSWGKTISEIQINTQKQEATRQFVYGNYIRTIFFSIFSIYDGKKR